MPVTRRSGTELGDSTPRDVLIRRHFLTRSAERNVRNCILAALPVLVAAVLLAGSGPLFPHAGETECPHTVESVAAGEVPVDATVLSFEDLSRSARRVVDSASDGGRVTIYGDCPDEFEYTDAPAVNHGIHYIKLGSSYRRVETSPGGPDTELIAQTALRVVALVLGLAGVALYRRRESVIAVGLGSAAVPLLGLRVGESVLGTPVARSLWAGLLVAVTLISIGAAAFVLVAER